MEMRKSSSKQIIAILLLVLGLAAAVVGVIGLIKGGGKDPYNVRQSVVMIFAGAQDNTGDSVAAMGTGFAVGKPGKDVEYIITNGHVVQYAYELPRMDATISGSVQVFFSAAENDFVSADIVYYSPFSEKDIAILKLPSPTDKREAVTIKDADKVSVGDTAYALGFPGVASNSQHFTTYDQNDITLTRGIVSKRTKPAWSNCDAFQMDVYINHGNSGGPLVDEKGHLIGINSSGAVDADGKNEGVNFAITSAELIKILDSERIDYTMAGASWVAFVFLPIGLVLLVLGIVLLVTSGKGAEAYAGAPVDSYGEAKPAAYAQKKAVLRGVTGKYAGQSFDLTKGKVVLGRDPATCNIVFEQNTPGISGRHCQVVYDPNEDCFIITDLGSSYGTFLGDGKKLTANVAEKLSNGDTFYLCDNANRFVVSKE